MYTGTYYDAPEAEVAGEAEGVHGRGQTEGEGQPEGTG